MALVNAFGAISLEATQQSVLAELVAIYNKLNAGSLTISNPFNLEATQIAVRADLDERYSGGKTAVGITLGAGGDNTVVTPSAGHSLRVVWVSAVPSTDNLNANLVKFKFGAGGTPFYQAYAIAHWEVFTGGVNVPLIVNCQTAENVAVTVHYREV